MTFPTFGRKALFRTVKWFMVLALPVAYDLRGALTVWFFGKLTGTPVADVLDQALAALARLWA